MSRNARVVRKVKRQTKWCGHTAIANVPNESNVAIGDGRPLCDTTTAVNEQADPVVGFCRGSLSLSRVTATDTAVSVTWAIVNMRLAPGSVLPVQVFDPYQEPDLERQDILGMGQLEIPAIILEADNTAIINHSTTVFDVNIKVGRRLRRNTNNLFLWLVSSGLDNAFLVRSTIRTLMKF